MDTITPKDRIRKPEWLKIKLPAGKDYVGVHKNITDNKLNTICQSGKCPNMEECWGRGTATIMILGNVCTRSCQFCNVETGKPEAVDIFEPARVGDSVAKMGVKHIVITSVDRDDLIDGGSKIWLQTIKAIRRKAPGVTMETLIPDFKGNTDNLDRIVEANPEVVSHNLETVERLSRKVRVQAKYEVSLDVLLYLKENGIHRTKSGVMLGLGETYDEVIQTMKDLRDHKVDVLTLGQYLQPSRTHLAVDKYVTPEEFEAYRNVALTMGFIHVESGPLVRSSYHAEKHIL
jgi:lipoyl synthase